jgi:hypothetical protein
MFQIRRAFFSPRCDLFRQLRATKREPVSCLAERLDRSRMQDRGCIERPGVRVQQPCGTKRRLADRLWGTGVEGRIGEFFVLGPMRQEAPTHHFWNALAILGTDGHQHRRGGWQIPVTREVRRSRVQVELQRNFEFGIIRGQSNAATHDRCVGSLALIPTRPIAHFRTIRRIELIAATQKKNK